MLPIRPAAEWAWQLALDHAQSFHDCLYLAMAVMADGLFATADVRFWKAMQPTIYAKHLLCIPHRA
jgi:predicted nucleic acid-binding protein